jgi:hypothetical protein
MSIVLFMLGWFVFSMLMAKWVGGYQDWRIR